MRGPGVTGMREGLFRLGVVSAIVLTSTAGCGTDEIVVAQVNVGQPCKTTSDCLPPGEYCEIGTCNADGGTCQVPPTSCDSDNSFNRVCGCDGVLFWNDCVRRSHSIAAVSHDCMSPSPPRDCTDQPCPPGSICGKYNFDCSPANTALSTCWVLPATCPSDNMGRYSSCDGTRSCMNLCNAIGTGEQYKEFSPFPSCN